jgi:hypothetical protein
VGKGRPPTATSGVLAEANSLFPKTSTVIWPGPGPASIPQSLWWPPRHLRPLIQLRHHLACPVGGEDLHGATAMAANGGAGNDQPSQPAEVVAIRCGTF